MSKPANKTMIGVFVLGSIVLAVVAIVLFGSGKFFKETDPWVAFFPGSVRGLNVGSPVVFRGVQVGQVTDIIVTFDPTELSVNIPVLFETNPDQFRSVGPEVHTDDREMHKALVARGLRAQLQLQSLVTGQLVINMDFFPDSPANLFGVENAGLDDEVKGWWEVPTISTTLEDLEKALGEIDFKEIANDFSRAMDGIAKLATSPDLHDSIGELKETLIAVKKLAYDVDSKVEPLANSLDQTLADARQLMKADIKQAADSAKKALDQAGQTLESIERLSEEGTLLRHEISTALTEIAAASRSVRVLADFIEQNPDAILRGRAAQTGGQ